MSLLPSSRSDASSTQTGEIELLNVSQEGTEVVLDALGSETARTVLAEIHDQPGTPSELADRVGTSVQNVLYHLRKLEDADLIEVVDTRYSEKGNEMDVYAPADDPTLVFVGTEQRESSLRRLLTRLLGAVGVLTVTSILFHFWIVGLPFGAHPDGAPAEPATTYPPGLAFFLGGLCLLVLLTVGWFLATRPDHRQ